VDQEYLVLVAVVVAVALLTQLGSGKETLAVVQERQTLEPQLQEQQIVAVAEAVLQIQVLAALVVLVFVQLLTGHKERDYGTTLRIS
jgi:Na+/H+ antiporter NhaC